MISDVLGFLRKHLNDQLVSQVDSASGELPEDKVVFVDGEKMDPISFKLGALSVLLINVEEENTLRSADPYWATAANGASLKVNPEIRVNLYVLFVAHFKQYETGLSYLSRVVEHFQRHRVFDPHSAPQLSNRIGKLVLELVTLPFSEQNEIWSALRTTYRPSVLYKVKMVVFRDEDARQAASITETALRTSP